MAKFQKNQKIIKKLKSSTSQHKKEWHTTEQQEDQLTKEIRKLKKQGSQKLYSNDSRFKNINKILLSHLLANNLRKS